MKIAFFEIREWEKRHLKRRLKKHSPAFYSEPANREKIHSFRDAEAISVFIYSKIDEEIIQKMTNLKLIATRSTGYDHIDVELCRQKGITVCNVPSYGENTVAEHTFALILSLSRNIHKTYIKSLRHDYSIDDIKGFDLKGKTLGVVGAGHIGLHVIRIAKSFEMNVLAYDINRNDFLAEVLGFRYVTMEELLNKSDIITLHVPYSRHTVLINTSRGNVVDTEAIIEALDQKILRGVGLDVLEGEELIKEEKQLLYDPAKMESLGKLVKDHILLSKDNVVFTPHIAFYSQEALERILNTTLGNIDAFIAGNPENIVA